MRVERARAHALVVRQFLSREFFRLKLAAKCFGRSSESSFPWSQEFVSSNETYQVSLGLTAMTRFSRGDEPSFFLLCGARNSLSHRTSLPISPNAHGRRHRAAAWRPSIIFTVVGGIECHRIAGASARPARPARKDRIGGVESQSLLIDDHCDVRRWRRSHGRPVRKIH
jgi:hypothetical protein